MPLLIISVHAFVGAAIGRPRSMMIRVRRNPMQNRNTALPDEQCSPLPPLPGNHHKVVAHRLATTSKNQKIKLEPSPAFFVSFPFSTKPIFSSHCWNSGMAVLPVSSRRVAVSRKPVVW